MPIGYYDSTANDGAGCYVDATANYQCTSLDSDGTGDYNGLTYFMGDPANGYYPWMNNSQYSSGGYFIAGVYTTLDSSGNGTWNDGWYFGAALATDLNALGTGYLAITFGTYSSGYYYLGGLTSLPSSGSGYWAGNTYASGYVSGWFIGGVLTTLDSCGNGSWDGSNYVDGVVSNSAWSSCANQWWYNGVYQSGVDSFGNGYSMTAGYYFLSGQQTTLDTMGSGFWDGHAYYNATQQATGWNGYYWYINDVETTLDSSGNGTWNGGTYVNGVLQTYGVTFAGSVSGDGDWANVANWLDANGGGAALLPDGSSAVTIIANVTQCSSGQPAILPSMVVDGASLGISVMVTPGLAVFKNGASLQSSLDGSAAFFDTSFMSAATVVGNATFYGNSSNRNGIGGTTTAAHGGGINGSNILGFA